MKSIIRIPILILAALIVLALAGCVPVPMMSTDQGLVIGQPFHLASGESINHDLMVVGGTTALDQNSTVNGNVAVVGGNVTIDGLVNGNLTTMGGDVTLSDHAHITGSIDSFGGSVNRSSKAVVDGKSTGNIPVAPFVTTVQTPAMRLNFDPITGPLLAIFQALALAALAIVVNLFAAAPMERTARTAVATPAASGGVGCLTLLVLVIMAITIILLPVSLLGFIVTAIAALFGWLAVGLLVGRQIAIWLNQTWTDPINAGVGTLSITLLAGLLNLIPCIGWMAGALVGLVALGAVVLTRFGTQVYPSSPYAVAPVQRPGPNGPTPVGPTPSGPGPYVPPPSPPGNPPQTGASVYPPESDQPGENPPAGPEGSNNA